MQQLFKPKFTSASLRSGRLIPRKTEVIKYTTEDEVHSAFIEAFVFIIFLTVCTTLALYSQSVYGYYSNDAFRRFLVRQEDFIWQISSITNIELWWKDIVAKYFFDIFKRLQWRNGTFNAENDPLGLLRKPYFWSANILLHPPRLRQIRVIPTKCKIHPFLNKFPEDCYKKYQPSLHDHSPVYKGTKHVDTSTNSGLRRLWGTVEYYDSGEYIVFLPYNYTATRKKISELRKIKWIDRGTRLVVLTLETFNYNLARFNIVRLITEILPTGSVVCAFSSESIPLETIWSTATPEIIFTAALFYLIATYYMGNEIYEISKLGIKQYAQIVWNYFDWGIIISAFASLVCSIRHISYVKKYLNDLEEDNELAALDTIAFNNVIYVGSLALCTFQMWIRIFRFIGFNQTMHRFNVTLKKCATEIFGFALILLIFFVIFAIIGQLAFGIAHPDFADFFTSFFFMFRLMLRDFDYEYFEEVNPLWGPIYFMTYVIVVVFVLVNMFLAIISRNYMEVKQKEPAETESAIKVVFEKLKRKLIETVKYIQRIFKAKAIFSASSTNVVKETSRAKQFSEDTEEEEKESPRELKKSEALQEYFGVEKKDSRTSLGSVSAKSSYKSFSDEVGDNVDQEEEAKSAAALQIITRLNERLNQLDEDYETLNADMDFLINQIDSQRKIGKH